jgi:phytoene synthase
MKTHEQPSSPTAKESPSSIQSPASSIQIAKKSKSNLAFALACLPAERRRDMISFYAFCRIVDDIADCTETPVDEKRTALAQWRHAVLHDGEGLSDPVLTEVVQLPAKYRFSPQLLAEIIDGVASDQDKVRYANFTELLAYCYKVACVVGIVSARIFGARDPRTDDYAIALGYALQLTNIMRDIGEDARESGRIYLPLDEMEKHGVTEADILTGRYSPGFTALMEEHYQRAHHYYDEAVNTLPRSDRRRMIAARMMAKIYGEILEKLHRTGYRVFDRRERLSSGRKAFILGSYWIKSMLGG